MLCQNCNAGGADLVGGITVGGHTVTADKDCLNPAVAHDRGSHVVADHGGVYAVGHHFVSGQAGTLQQGTGFVSVDFEVHAQFAAHMDRGKRGAVTGGGQLPCVAVRQNAVTVLNQGQTVFADGAADPDVFVTDFKGFLAQKVFQFRYAAGGVFQNNLLHTVQRPCQIDGSGAGADQIILNSGELCGKGGVVGIGKAAADGVDADCCGHADGGSAAHPQKIDCLINGLGIGKPQKHGFAGQSGLIDDDQLVGGFVHCDGIVTQNVILIHTSASFGSLFISISL